MLLKTNGASKGPLFRAISRIDDANACVINLRP